MSDTADDVNMLEYFWSEKGDVNRYVGYDKWAKQNPDDARELTRLIADRDWAEKRIGSFIKDLRQRFPLPEETTP